MAAPGKQPKQMSSRLAGMKFMQRNSLGGTPSTPTTPSSEPPAKKQRLSNGSSIRSPATPLDPPTPTTAERQSSSNGETKWYLSFKAPQKPVAESPLRIVSAGYASLDSTGRPDMPSDDEQKETEDGGRLQIQGRQSFGKFDKKLEKRQNPDVPSESDSESDEDAKEEDGEVEDDPTGVNALIAQGRKEATDRARAERKAKKAAESAKATELAANRRKKEVDLNNVTSISGGGSSSGLSNMICHGCGNKGHRKKDCPQAKKSRRSY